MTEARRKAAEARQARVLGCISRHLAQGEGFPSARLIREETGISSLATVHKYIHQLALAGQICLPEHYPAPSAEEGVRVLSVRHKHLTLSGEEALSFDLAIVRLPGGQTDARIVRLRRAGTPLRILSCTEIPQGTDRKENDP